MVLKRYGAALLSTLFIIFVVYRILSGSIKSIIIQSCSTASPIVASKYSPVVQLFGPTGYPFTLAIVQDVFKKMGYQVQYTEIQEWDVLWSFAHPFDPPSIKIKNLKSKMVNHVPGTFYISHKANLITLGIKSAPKAFPLPSMKDEFIQYASAKKNKDKMWILKGNYHRGMKLFSGFEDLDVNGSFIQEFIKNPLLINQRRFDLGIYVLLTSIDPLRVYVYSDDILLRFCKKEYIYPPDPKDPESFVVGGKYLPIWEVDNYHTCTNSLTVVFQKVPDLKFYYSTLNYTAKESFIAYLESQGKDPRKIWHQIIETIRSVYIKAEDVMIEQTLPLGTLRSFFELVRFDFIVDEDLNVYLMEVNMSPNLSNSYFHQLKLIFEQLIFNTISLVGLARKVPGSFVYRGELEVSDKDIQVFSQWCGSLECVKSCSQKCSFCNSCMENEKREVVKSAYLEFMNRGKFRRVLPSPITYEASLNKSASFTKFAGMNGFMEMWYMGKCVQDPSWCY